MDTTVGRGSALAECTALLDDEGRRAVRWYWSSVVWAASEPPTRFVPASAPLPADEHRERRQRRETRRAMARVAAAGRRSADVIVLPVSPATGVVVLGAGEAA